MEQRPEGYSCRSSDGKTMYSWGKGKVLVIEIGSNLDVDIVVSSAATLSPYFKIPKIRENLC